MANPIATQVIVGNVGKKWDKRTTKNGDSVINFAVGATPRKKVDDEWVDGTPYWIKVVAWGKLADNIEESFNIGDRVFVSGRMEQSPNYENEEGEEQKGSPILRAEFAGLEISRYVAHSDKPNHSNSSKTTYHQKKQSEVEEEAKPRVEKKTEPNIDDPFDLGLDDDGDEDIPF